MKREPRHEGSKSRDRYVRRKWRRKSGDLVNVRLFVGRGGLGWGEEGVVGERKSSQLAAYPEKREWALFVGSAEVDPCLFT